MVPEPAASSGLRVRFSPAIRGGRTLGAVLLLGMAAIHLLLWIEGYREVPLIGPAFLANTVGGVVLAAALAFGPRRWLPAVAGLAALFLAGTLVALLLSATVGLFGFIDTLDAPLARAGLIVEAAGALVCGATALLAVRDRRAPQLRHDPGTGVWLRAPR